MDWGSLGRAGSGLQSWRCLILVEVDWMKRIICLIAVFAVFAVKRPALALPRLEASHVTLDYVAKKAELRARKPFRSPRADLPAFLSRMTYDEYREIEFRHDRALWAEEGLPFRMEFFHLLTSRA